jgi:hypothetical protein
MQQDRFVAYLLRYKPLVFENIHFPAGELNYAQHNQ